MKIIPGRRIVAVVNIVVGALLVFGGVQEAVAYWGEQLVHVIVGSLGATTAAALFVSGFFLWKQRNHAQAFTAISCVAVIVVHVAAWEFRFLGILAFLLSILYPAVVLLWFWRGRKDALPVDNVDGTAVDDEKRGGSLRRIALNDAM